MMTVKQQLLSFLFDQPDWTPKWKIENFANTIQTKKGAILKDNIDRRMRELRQDNPDVVLRKIINGVAHYKLG